MPLIKIKLKEKIKKILQVDVDVGIEAGLEWTEWKPIPQWVLKVYIKAHRRLKREKNRVDGERKSQSKSNRNSDEST